MKKTVLAFSLIAISNFVLANDGVEAAGAGGIILGKTDAVAMKKEVLTISRRKISVDYDFLNESQIDEDVPIIFPLPIYHSRGEEDGHFGEPGGFSIKVNGTDVEFKTVIRAYLDDEGKGKDYAPDLRKIGLSDQQIALFPQDSPFNSKVPALTKTQLSALKTKGLVDDNDVPSWRVQVIYRWKQNFPAGKAIHVHHEYMPFTSGGPGMVYPSDFSKQNIFCTDQGFKKSFDKAYDQHVKQGSPFSSAEVSYVLKTANSWKSGVEDFTLILKKESPKEIVSLCFPSDIKRTGDSTLESHIANFRPDADLNIFFTNIDDSNDPSETSPVAPQIK